MTRAVLLGLVALSARAQQWPVYAGDDNSAHYSTFDRITRANGASLFSCPKSTQFNPYL